MTKQYSADLARLCANLSGEDISPAVRERVRYLLLDHLAVTLRGSLLPSSLAAYQMLYIVHGIHAEEVTISGGMHRFLQTNRKGPSECPDGPFLFVCKNRWFYYAACSTLSASMAT